MRASDLHAKGSTPLGNIFARTFYKTRCLNEVSLRRVSVDPKRRGATYKSSEWLWMNMECWRKLTAPTSVNGGRGPPRREMNPKKLMWLGRPHKLGVNSP